MWGNCQIFPTIFLIPYIFRYKLWSPALFIKNRVFSRKYCCKSNLWRLLRQGEQYERENIQSNPKETRNDLKL